MTTLLALLAFVAIMGLAGFLLARLSSRVSHQPVDQLIDVVNATLPQTQCAQCGYPGCRPYATAIVTDDAPINQCPPGGDSLIRELAELLGKPVIALDTGRGVTKPAQVAVIDESLCIGCTLCIAACPVDAIVGASRLMHTVLADQCTGCELCLPPCPVDCIALLPAPKGLHQWRWPKPA
jgi:electron transport complex protein RnfB